MDMITLAMAKAYTDEKVASGGGSGGGVCLPVVELGKYELTGNANPVPESAVEILDKAAADRIPVVVKCTLETVSFHCVANVMEVSGVAGYWFAVYGLQETVVIQQSDGIWNWELLQIE